MDNHDARCERIRREQDEANFLKARIATAEARHEAAAQALDLARRDKRDAEQELALLRRRYAEVPSELAQQRATFHRGFMRTCPAELLIRIFEEVTALPDHLRVIVSEEQCFDKTLATAPFHLAAVCSRWRQVALQEPTLWTYMTSPRNGAEANDGYVARNMLVLQRSTNRVLDIFLCWDLRDWNQCAAEKQLLLALGRHAQRWRTFELWLPDDNCKLEYLFPLKGPLPRLERLCIVAEHSSLDDIRATNCLPSAPELREAVIWGPCPLILRPIITFPALSDLRLHQLTLSRVWELLVAVAPTLEHLGLTLNHDESSGPANALTPRRLRFRSLHSFALLVADSRSLPALQSLDLPALNHLSLSCCWIKPRLLPFLERIAPSVTDLTLTGPEYATVDQLRVLKALVYVKVLTFDTLSPEVTSEYSVSEEFFGSREHWMQDLFWPNLSSIHFSPGGELLLVNEGSSIINFIRRRSEEISREQGRVGLRQACRLREVRFDLPKTPRWLVNEVHKLIDTGTE